MVSIRLAVRGGSRTERIAGQGLLAGRALSEGTARRDWVSLAEDIESRGMSASGFGGWDAHGVAVDALAEDASSALAIAAEMLLEANFPADRCRLLTKQAAGELQSLADQPEVLTGWAFLRELYGEHPQARPLQGSAESLETLAAADLESFHVAGLGRGLILSITGEIDPDETRERVNSIFGAAPSSSDSIGYLAPPPASPGARGARREVTTGARDQAHLYLGHLTIPRHHADLAALEVLSVILGAGAGLTGRIPERVREDEGLAYTAYASAVSGAGLDAGRLVAYVGTSPATLDRAERAVREEFDRLLQDGLREEEVTDAKAYLIGRDPFRRETARQWADLLAESDLYGEPFDDADWAVARIQAVDRAAVEEAARRWIRPEAMVAAVGLPPAR